MEKTSSGMNSFLDEHFCLCLRFLPLPNVQAASMASWEILVLLQTVLQHASVLLLQNHGNWPIIPFYSYQVLFFFCSVHSVLLA